MQKTITNRLLVVLPATATNVIIKSINAKYGVDFNSNYGVFCGMGKQRKNEILHQRVVERLKEIRKHKGLTQETVRIDLGDLNIGRIESGQHSITLTTLADLCDYYEISLEEFFKGIETK